MSKLLKSLVCHHKCLTEGPIKKRLKSKKARLLLLHFLVSKAESFGADVTPVKVDTMERLREVIRSGEEFYVVNEEVLNSKVFQTFRAKLEKDHAKSELDLIGVKKRGKVMKNTEDAAVRMKVNEMKLLYCEMILADEVESKEKMEWIAGFMDKLVNLKVVKSKEMKKLAEEMKKMVEHEQMKFEEE